MPDDPNVVDPWLDFLRGVPGVPDQLPGIQAPGSPGGQQQVADIQNATPNPAAPGEQVQQLGQELAPPPPPPPPPPSGLTDVPGMQELATSLAGSPLVDAVKNVFKSLDTLHSDNPDSTVVKPVIDAAKQVADLFEHLTGNQIKPDALLTLAAPLAAGAMGLRSIEELIKGNADTLAMPAAPSGQPPVGQPQAGNPAADFADKFVPKQPGIAGPQDDQGHPMGSIQQHPSGDLTPPSPMPMINSGGAIPFNGGPSGATDAPPNEWNRVLPGTGPLPPGGQIAAAYPILAALSNPLVREVLGAGPPGEQIAPVAPLAPDINVLENIGGPPSPSPAAGSPQSQQQGIEAVKSIAGNLGQAGQEIAQPIKQDTFTPEGAPNPTTPEEKADYLKQTQEQVGQQSVADFQQKLDDNTVFDQFLTPEQKQFTQEMTTKAMTGPVGNETFEDYQNRLAQMTAGTFGPAPGKGQWVSFQDLAQKNFESLPKEISEPPSLQIQTVQQARDSYNQLDSTEQRLIAAQQKLAGWDPSNYPTPDYPQQLANYLGQVNYAKSQLLASLEGPFGDYKQFIRDANGNITGEQLLPEKVFGDATARIWNMAPTQTLLAESQMDNTVLNYAMNKLASEQLGNKFYGMAPVRQNITNLGTDWQNRQGFQQVDQNDIRFQGTDILGFVPVTDKDTGDAEADYWKHGVALPTSMETLLKQVNGYQPWQVGLLQRMMNKNNFPVSVTETPDNQTKLALATYYLYQAIPVLVNNRDKRDDPAALDELNKAQQYATDWGKLVLALKGDTDLASQLGVTSQPNLFNLERTKEADLPENQPGLPADVAEGRYWVRQDLMQHFQTGALENMAKGSEDPVAEFAKTLAFGEGDARFDTAMPLLMQMPTSGIGKASLFDIYLQSAPMGVPPEVMISNYIQANGKDSVPSQYQNQIVTHQDKLDAYADHILSAGRLAAGDVGNALGATKDFLAPTVGPTKTGMNALLEVNPLAHAAIIGAAQATDMIANTALAHGAWDNLVVKPFKVVLPGVTEDIDRGGLFLYMLGKSGVDGLRSDGFDGLVNSISNWRDVATEAAGNKQLWNPLHPYTQPGAVDANQPATAPDLAGQVMQDMGIDPAQHNLLHFAASFGLDSFLTLGLGAGVKAAAETTGAGDIAASLAAKSPFIDDSVNFAAGTEDMPTLYRATNGALFDHGGTLAEDVRTAQTPEAVRAAFVKHASLPESSYNGNADMLMEHVFGSPGAAIFNQAKAKVIESGILGSIPAWIARDTTLIPETANGVDVAQPNFVKTVHDIATAAPLGQARTNDYINMAHMAEMQSGLTGANTVTGQAIKRSLMDQLYYEITDKAAGKMGISRDELFKSVPSGFWSPDHNSIYGEKWDWSDDLGKWVPSGQEGSTIKASEAAASTTAQANELDMIRGISKNPAILKTSLPTVEADPAAVEQALRTALPKEAQAATKEGLPLPPAEEPTSEALPPTPPEAGGVLTKSLMDDPRFADLNLTQVPAPKTGDQYIQAQLELEQLKNMEAAYREAIFNQAAGTNGVAYDQAMQALATDDDYLRLRAALAIREELLPHSDAYLNGEDLQAIYGDLLQPTQLNWIKSTVGAMRDQAKTMADKGDIPVPAFPFQINNYFRREIPFTYLSSLNRMSSTAIAREQLQAATRADAIAGIWKKIILAGWGTQAKILFGDDFSRLMAKGILAPKWFTGKGLEDINVPESVVSGDLNRIIQTFARPSNFLTMGEGGELPLTKGAYEQWMKWMANDKGAQLFMKTDAEAAAKGLGEAERHQATQKALEDYYRKAWEQGKVNKYSAYPFAAGADKSAAALMEGRAESDLPGMASSMNAQFRYGGHFGEDAIKPIFDKFVASKAKKAPTLSDEEWQTAEAMQPHIWGATDGVEKGVIRQSNIYQGVASAVNGIVDKNFSILQRVTGANRSAVYRYYYQKLMDDFQSTGPLEGQSLETAKYLADAKATKAVEDVTYNFARTPLEVALRNVYPFMPAYRDFNLFWAKQLATHPAQALVVSDLIHRLPNSTTATPMSVASQATEKLSGLPVVGGLFDDAHKAINRLGDVTYNWAGLPADSFWQTDPRKAFFFTGGSDNYMLGPGPYFTVPLGQLIAHDPEDYKFIQDIPGMSFANPDSPMFSKIDKLTYAVTGQHLPAPLGMAAESTDKKVLDEYNYLFDEEMKKSGGAYPDEAQRAELMGQAQSSIRRQQALLFAGQYTSPAGTSLVSPAGMLSTVKSMMHRAETPQDLQVIADYFQGKGGQLPDYLTSNYQGAPPSVLPDGLKDYAPLLAQYMTLTPRGREELIRQNPQLLPYTLTTSSGMGADGKPTYMNPQAYLTELTKVQDAQTKYNSEYTHAQAAVVVAKKWEDIMAAQGGKITGEQAMQKNMQMRDVGASLPIVAGKNGQPPTVNMEANNNMPYADYLVTSIPGGYANRYSDTFVNAAKQEEQKRIDAIVNLKGSTLTNLSTQELGQVGLPNDAPTMQAIQTYTLAKNAMDAQMKAQGITATSAAGKALAAGLDQTAHDLAAQYGDNFVQIYQLSKLPEWDRTQQLGLGAHDPATQDIWNQAYAVLAQMSDQMATLKAAKDQQAAYQNSMMEIAQLQSQNAAFATQFAQMFPSPNDLKPTATQLRAYVGDFSNVSPSRSSGGRGGGRGRKGGRGSSRSGKGRGKGRGGKGKSKKGSSKSLTKMRLK